MNSQDQHSSHSGLPSLPPGSYLIYVIRRRSDQKTYVGLTSRSLAARIRAHIQSAMRPGKVRVPDSLLDAIRQALMAGYSFDEAFTAFELIQGLGRNEACLAEDRWIHRLHALAPVGFNVRVGGRSVGGPGNSQPATFLHPVEGTLSFSSIYKAITYRNRELRAEGRRVLDFSTVYARLNMQWPIEEALGYQPHVDGRSIRHLFTFDGVTYDTIREASNRLGIPVSTIRSRLHRAKTAGAGDADMAVDRRKSPVAKNCARCVDIKAVAREHGLPVSTISYRYHQLELAGKNPANMDSMELRRHLTTAQDRRHLITLKLDDGSLVTGGQRSVIQSVLSNPLIAQNRKELLGESAIRRRLRTIDAPTPQAIRWAFGFSPIPAEPQRLQ